MIVQQLKTITTLRNGVLQPSLHHGEGGEMADVVAGTGRGLPAQQRWGVGKHDSVWRLGALCDAWDWGAMSRNHLDT